MSNTRNVPSRRALVSGVVGLGVGAPLLVACGSDAESSGGSGSSSSSGSSSGSSSSGAIAKTSDIPEGGGKIFDAEKVVITQPTAGEFKAFDSTCTHQGCPVTKISGDEIECTCHGSKFSIADGSNTAGPNGSEAGSVEPLAEKKITQTGEDLSVS